MMTLLQSIWTVTWKSFAFIITWAIPLAFFIVPFQSRLKQIEQTNPPLFRLYLESVSAITIVFAAYILLTGGRFAALALKRITYSAIPHWESQLGSCG